MFYVLLFIYLFSVVVMGLSFVVAVLPLSFGFIFKVIY